MEMAVGKLSFPSQNHEPRPKAAPAATSPTGDLHPAPALTKGSVEATPTEVKEAVLHVSPRHPRSVGAVSEATVREMIKSVLAAMAPTTPCRIRHLGPDGGRPAKPVGMVWVAVGNKDRTITQQSYFRFDRHRNIELTSTMR